MGSKGISIGQLGWGNDPFHMQDGKVSPIRGHIDSKGLALYGGKHQRGTRTGFEEGAPDQGGQDAAARVASRVREGLRLPPRSGQGSQRSGTMKPGSDCLIQAASSAGGRASPCQSTKAAGR